MRRTTTNVRYHLYMCIICNANKQAVPDKTSPGSRARAHTHLLAVSFSFFQSTSILVRRRLALAVPFCHLSLGHLSQATRQQRTPQCDASNSTYQVKWPRGVAQCCTLTSGLHRVHCTPPQTNVSTCAFTDTQHQRTAFCAPTDVMDVTHAAHTPLW